MCIIHSAVTPTFTVLLSSTTHPQITDSSAVHPLSLFHSRNPPCSRNDDHASIHPHHPHCPPTHPPTYPPTHPQHPHRAPDKSTALPTLLVALDFELGEGTTTPNLGTSNTTSPSASLVAVVRTDDIPAGAGSVSRSIDLGLNATDQRQATTTASHQQHPISS
jgi:hypothetical protein